LIDSLCQADDVRETIFLAIANNLPRSRLADRFRHVLCALAGMRIKDRCMIWGPLTIRPLGGARNIAIGSGRFLNANSVSGCPLPR